METQLKQWKILDLLKTTENLFRDKSVSNPRLSSEILLANTLNIERIQLYVDFDKPLTEAELAEFRAKVKRRLNNEPLQYISGVAYFYGNKFSVNPSVLIPRPETELLVEKTLEVINKRNLGEPRILEIGAGSGCVSISIALNINCSIESIDIDPAAVQTASENYGKFAPKGKVNFKTGDFLKDNIDFSKYDIVISNPPYIPISEVESLSAEIREFEPRQALTDFGDGLGFYRRILELYSSAEKKPVVLIEIGDGKRNAVEALIKEHKINNYTFHKDLINIERVLEF